MRPILSALAVIALLLLLTIVPLLAQEGISENESNNTVNSSDVIEEDQFVISGEIGDVDDLDDWYALSGTGNSYTITMTFDPDQVEVDWEVIDDGKNDWDDREVRTLASMTDFGSPESVTVESYGHCYIHVWAYSGQGSYTITLGDTECQGLDENEPNDTMEQADNAPFDVIEGIACANDSDWYQLMGQEGDRPTFTLSFDSSEVEVDWEIYSGDQLVARNTDYGSPEVITVEAPDLVYIHVWQFSGEGSYMIDINE